jgi:lipid-binding SYLF domain-containing protein
MKLPAHMQMNAVIKLNVIKKARDIVLLPVVLKS